MPVWGYKKVDDLRRIMINWLLDWAWAYIYASKKATTEIGNSLEKVSGNDTFEPCDAACKHAPARAMLRLRHGGGPYETKESLRTEKSVGHLMVNYL